MTNDANSDFSAFLHRHWRYDHPHATGGGKRGDGVRCADGRGGWPLRSAPSSRAAATVVSS